MRRFAALYQRIDETNRTHDKVAALADYFREAPPADAAWALYFLTGRKLKRAVNHRLLRSAAADASGYPLWLVDECCQAVGDIGEAIALLLPDPERPADLPLHRLVEEDLEPLPYVDEGRKRRSLLSVWPSLPKQQRLVYHKLLTGEFRVGVARTLVIRALANVAGVDPTVMADRLAGRWRPTAEDYRRLLRGEQHDDPARPYPFYLAYPLEDGPESLGDAREWLVEWKWDGIRAQLIHRGGRTLLWSRGDDPAGEWFPELLQAAETLPDGTVLDGEVVGWRDDGPLPFSELQKRLGRKRVQPTLFEPDVPVVFMAYDLLEADGVDMRSEPLETRRQRLERLVGSLEEPLLPLSPALAASTWADVRERYAAVRETGAEGVMLKRWRSTYGVGRKKGDWWKWKVPPLTVDAVLIHAEPGHGERASLFTDYTFGVWDGGELVPVAKAYSGLTDAEIRRVDAFVRRHTRERHGPVRVVEPRLVFELAFERLMRSSRHRSGLAVRFPRMARWRHDKAPEEADTLETLRLMLDSTESTPRAK